MSSSFSMETDLIVKMPTFWDLLLSNLECSLFPASEVEFLALELLELRQVFASVYSFRGFFACFADFTRVIEDSFSLPLERTCHPGCCFWLNSWTSGWFRVVVPHISWAFNRPFSSVITKIAVLAFTMVALEACTSAPFGNAEITAYLYIGCPYLLGLDSFKSWSLVFCPACYRSHHSRNCFPFF